jgi:molecular chaperone GrpE
VVQVEITKPENTEKSIQEGPQKDLKEISTETDDQEGGNEKEVPLEKLTKAKLLDKSKELQETADSNFDLYVRSQAEIENLKKRFQKEKADLCKFSNESLIRQLLSVVDNLEKAIAHSENEGSLDALKEGVKLTLKGFMDILRNSGLESVQAMNETFDPNFHQAVSEQEDSSVKPGTVIQELQSGYLLNQRLIRPAMVVVSKRGG